MTRQNAAIELVTLMDELRDANRRLLHRKGAARSEAERQIIEIKRDIRRNTAIQYATRKEVSHAG